MNISLNSANPSMSDPALEESITSIEHRLASLGEALRARDSVGIDCHSSGLHSALAKAVEHFSSAAQAGSIPPALRRRLATASGQVAAQRESLARATAALDRAIDVLLPRDNAALYSTYGGPDRRALGSGIRA